MTPVSSLRAAEKLCVFCVHMETESWGSDSMGGHESFICNKRHFDGPATVYFLRENILRAENCRDYRPATVERSSQKS